MATPPGLHLCDLHIGRLSNFGGRSNHVNAVGAEAGTRLRFILNFTEAFIDETRYKKNIRVYGLTSLKN